MTTTGVGTQIVRVRARFGTDRLSMIEAQDHLYDLSCLMLTGYMLGAAVPRPRQDRTSGLSQKTAAERAVRAANDTRVHSIKYNSPLEVILTLSSMGVFATLVGDRLLHLYRDIQETRVVTAVAKTRLMCERIVQQHLEEHLSGPSSEQVTQWVEGAARAGRDIEHLEVEPDYE